jgi:cytochrome c biogenesis protein CcdA/thiol-disulfide isomerase/thioredoxin
MTLFLLAYLAGVLTIATPCILPVVPFVLAGAHRSFRSSGLPMLLGMSVAFAITASLAAVAGNWVVELNRYGRTAALISMGFFGLGLLLPSVTGRLAKPFVSLGARLSDWAQGRRFNVSTSVTLGVATGLLWTPCAGPILGLILSAAALNGPSLQTATLLLTYGMGAATALAGVLLIGQGLLRKASPFLGWLERVRRLSGVAVLGSVALIGFGLDTGLLTRLSADRTSKFENGLLTALDQSMVTTGSTARARERDFLSGPLTSLLGKPDWVNTRPLGAEDLKGKVIVVNFWTYSCINCLRTLPHLRDWAEAYRDRSLVVIGVHSPEFAFERDISNVRRATSSLGILYPVVLDNRFDIWGSFRNSGWPGIVIVGADGRVQYRTLGEGGLDKAEQAIKDLLTEADGVAHSGSGLSPDGGGLEMAADWANLRSPETYVGHSRAARFRSQTPLMKDSAADYRHADKLELNEWSLGGHWAVGPEFATLRAASGRLRYRFHARDLHLVLVPETPHRDVRFRITVDGAEPQNSHGSDVDRQGRGVIRAGRLYQLVRQAGLVADRTFEIEFLDPGVHVYAFTFG